MLTPRQVIEDIRRSQYGIGLPPDSAWQPVNANILAQLDGALKLLSEDLYAKDIHFVLELLQNAEDNSYAPDVVPEIRFRLTEEAILVQNNELGFSEENVRSLCAVAKSSKPKRLGYIGEKGIGFKSVFRVTDEPYISSNGFSFSLPLHDPQTGLGYIIPVWREERPAGIDCNLTNILLPLSPKGKQELPKIAELEPSLLLFLKKLRRIEILDAAGICTSWMQRDDDDDGVTIRSGQGAKWWRVVKQSLTVPPKIAEEKRRGVTAVEAILAFPLSSDGSADASAECPVYSFLPVRPYGFRFAIQADFILASSREDILTDRPWNQWLRDCIPSLFLDAVELFKADSTLRTNFFAFVPSATQVRDPFFQGIPGTIIELLKETECVLTASGRWALPSEVLVVTDALRELIPNEDVKAHLQKEFVAKDFQADTELLRQLGVKQFGFAELVQCLKDTTWLAAKEEKWLVQLFAYLNRTWSKEALDTLRALTLVPLESGGFESPAKGQLFFPLDKRTSYGFEAGLRVVRRSLFKAGGPQAVDAARKFLRGSLGVRIPDPVEIINEHIMPVFEGDNAATNWKSKDDGFLLGAVEYIRDHVEAFEKAGGSIERLKKGLYIKFVHPEGRWYMKATELYLPKAYGNRNDLESLLQGIEEIHFADPAYFEHSLGRLKKPVKNGSTDVSAKEKREQVESWRNFFVRLGVETVLRVSSPPAVSDPDQITSPDLGKILATKDVDRLTKLLTLLDQHWPRYRQYLRIERFTLLRNRRHSLGTFATAFFKLLSGSAWIPTKNHGLCRPHLVCVDTSENRDLLGDHVPYLAVEVESEELLADLQLQAQPTVSAALSCLRALTKEDVKDVRRCRKLYAFLDKHFEEDSSSISTAFEDESLIYIPARVGSFKKRSEVFWKDVSWLFGATRSYLSVHWKDMREFFVTKLEVPLTPGPDDYVELLKEMRSAGELEAQGVQKVWEIYKEIERQLSAADSDYDPTSTSWWQEFAKSGLYWTDGAEFWHNEGDVYINDQEEYYQLFKGKGEFAVLVLPENQFPSFTHLIEAGKLRLLSEAVQVCEITPGFPRQDPSLTQLIREAAPFIERYLYFREHEVYRALQDAAVLTKLGQASVQICESLKASFEFHGVSVEVDRDVAGTLPRLYVLKDIVDPVDRLGVILSKLLHAPRGLDSFICLLLTKKGKEAMERLMEAQRIPRMPACSLVPEAVEAESDDVVSADRTAVEDEASNQNVEAGESSYVGEDGHEASRSGEAGAERSDRFRDTQGRLPTLIDGQEEEGESAESEYSGQASDKVSPSPSGSPVPVSGQGRQGPDKSEATDGDSGSEEGKRGSHRREESPDQTTRERPARNWFRVLARPGEASETSGPGDPPPRDDLAREKVIEFEERRGRPAKQASSTQEGYDVTSDDRLRGVTRLIEVKGLQQRWTGDATVTMTGAQFDASRNDPPAGHEYWLYVVDGLGTDSPRVHPILRPAAKVERVYLQAQDWIGEVDQADRDRLTDRAVAELGLPIVALNEIATVRPATAFITRYSRNDLADIVPVGGFLKCLPLASTAALPPKGRLVMLLPGQMAQGDEERAVAVGEFRWSIRQSLEGEPQYVEVSLRPKTADATAKPVTIRVPIADWPSFRPYAACEPVLGK
jgi:hypothetical protein